MPKFETRRRVNHSARQMYDLVADVERYPQFLPLCEALRVRTRTPTPGGGEVLIADMEVGYRAIREKFTSRVTLEPASQTIRAAYLDGPFRHMDNRWTFVDVPGTATEAAASARPQCDVIFFIDYEFKSALLQLLMGSVFDQAFRKFTSAFEGRAHAVYG